MPLIVGAIVWLITKFLVRFSASLVYKWALRAAIVAAIVTAVAALWAAIMSLKGLLVVATLDSPWMQVGLTAVLPWNFELVLTIIGSARFLDWMFRFNYRIFEKILAVEKTGLPKTGW